MPTTYSNPKTRTLLPLLPHVLPPPRAVTTLVRMSTSTVTISTSLLMVTSSTSTLAKKRRMPLATPSPTLLIWKRMLTTHSKTTRRMPTLATPCRASTVTSSGTVWFTTLTMSSLLAKMQPITLPNLPAPWFRAMPAR